MSKGTRKREANAVKQQQKLEREKFEANKRRVRKITAIVTSALILCVILVAIGSLIVETVRLNRGEYLRSEVAASSSGIEVDGAMMNYYFNDTYNTFVDYYGSYVGYFGLNTELSLKQQEVSDGETWFEYFMGGAKDTVTNILMLNEAAASEGVTLSDAEKAAVRSRTDGMDEGLYGRGTNNNDIYNAKLLEALAYKYQFMKEDELSPTDSEIIEYYEENAKSYQYIDYYSFPLYYVSPDEDSSTEREQAIIITEDDVKGFADKLSAATSEDQYKEIVREILLTEDPDMTEEDIEAELASIETVGAMYSEDNEFLKWAFTAETGDTYVVPNTDEMMYTVYMLTASPYRSENSTVNVRHILLSDAVYGSREKALKKAEELLAELESAGNITEAFALLALEYSEDPGSYYNGGLYLNVTEGYMIESFNDWCFYADRKEGDTGIVESDYGVHVMYFEGDGGEEWKASVSADITSQRFDELTAEWSKMYTVVFDDTVLDSIPG